MPFFKITTTIVKYLLLTIRKKYYKTPLSTRRLVKKLFKLQQILFSSTKSISFNKSKFNNLVLDLRNIGLIPLIQKLYGKKVEIKVVELKSIHLNSDLFSSAVALKLRDRNNKAVSVLRKAIMQVVKIPDLHTLITFDDSVKNNNIHTYDKPGVPGTVFNPMVYTETSSMIPCQEEITDK